MNQEVESQQAQQFDRIVNLINSSYSEKNKDNIEEIRSFISSHYLYLYKVLRNLEQNDLESFIKGLQCKTYNHNDLVEVQGTQSTRFGIIMKGRVKILSSNNGKKKQYHESKMFLGAGDKIGAESMLLEKVNLFSLITVSDQLVLLEIEKYYFDRCIRQLESERLESNLAFLKSTQLFRHITNDSILTMILYNSVKISFQNNEVVYSQDQNLYAIYIVIQGKFQVQQRFQDEPDQSMDQASICSDNQDASQTPKKQQNLDQSSFVSGTSILKVRTVESYEIFGEEEIVDQRQRTSTVVCLQDLSEVLVIRPIIYKSCILKDDAVKKKLLELIGQKQQEAKTKEKQKREKCQSLNLSKIRRLNSSSSMIQTPKNCQVVVDAKESQFARLHKINQNNQFQVLSQEQSEENSLLDSQFSPFSSNSKQKKLNFQFQDEFKDDKLDFKSDLDTFGGFIQRQESIFSPDCDFLETKNSKSQNFQSIQENPLEFSTGLEVSGRKITDFNLINRTHRILYKHIHSSAKQNQSMKVDFQAGPYQVQKDTDNQNYFNTEVSMQFENFNSPLSFKNIKQEQNNSVTNTPSSQLFKNSKKKIVYSYSMCNSPKLSDSHIFTQTKAQANQNNLAFSNFRIQNQNQSMDCSIKQQQIQDKIKFIKNYFKFSQQQKDQEQINQLNESSRFQIKQQSNKDSIIDNSQIFSQSRKFPLTSENKKIRIKSLSQAGSRNKIIKTTQGDVKNSSYLLKESINRPAIIVPNSIPLQSPLSSIFSTQLNLSSLQQLKQKVYQQKPLDVEKYAFYQANQKVPFSTQSQKSQRKYAKNHSQPLLKHDLNLQTDIK